MEASGVMAHFVTHPGKVPLILVRNYETCWDLHLILRQYARVCSACSGPSLEGTVLFSVLLLQIDTFDKSLKCLTKVCYLKLKKKTEISRQTQII